MNPESGMISQYFNHEPLIGAAFKIYDNSGIINALIKTIQIVFRFYRLACSDR